MRVGKQGGYGTEQVSDLVARFSNAYRSSVPRQHHDQSTTEHNDNEVIFRVAKRDVYERMLDHSGNHRVSAVRKGKIR